jgi:hypothetical protein
MKIYDCGDCYITTRLADWEVLAMLQGEGWDLHEVTEITEAEYQRGTSKPVAIDKIDERTSEMITQLEANQWTKDFLNKLQDKKFFQREAIFEYSCLLAVGQRDLFNWTKINNAIIDKWSKSGLIKIKRAAWKEIQ